jgi:hypothetical protein
MPISPPENAVSHTSPGSTLPLVLDCQQQQYRLSNSPIENISLVPTPKQIFLQLLSLPRIAHSTISSPTIVEPSPSISPPETIVPPKACMTQPFKRRLVTLAELPVLLQLRHLTVSRPPSPIVFGTFVLPNEPLPTTSRKSFMLHAWSCVGTPSKPLPARSSLYTDPRWAQHKAQVRMNRKTFFRERAK